MSDPITLLLTVCDKMVSSFVIWSVSVLAVQGAVLNLNREDTLLKRIARSSCLKCAGPLPPPPPPPIPFSKGVPPPPGHAGSSASSQANSYASSGSSGQILHGNGFQNGVNAGPGFPNGANGGLGRIEQPTQKGFNTGSVASAQAVSGSYSQNGPKGAKLTGNQQSLGRGFQQNGFKGSSASASAQAVSSYNKDKQGFSGNQQALGAQQKAGSNSGTLSGLKNLSQPQKGSDKGCSSCGGSSAVSNAQSHSGSATAVAVNNG